jgi:hypothetical protein
VPALQAQNPKFKPQPHTKKKRKRKEKELAATFLRKFQRDLKETKLGAGGSR